MSDEGMTGGGGFEEELERGLALLAELDRRLSERGVTLRKDCYHDAGDMLFWETPDGRSFSTTWRLGGTLFLCGAVTLDEAVALSTGSAAKAEALAALAQDAIAVTIGWGWYLNELAGFSPNNLEAYPMATVKGLLGRLHELGYGRSDDGGRPSNAGEGGA